MSLYSSTVFWFFVQFEDNSWFSSKENFIQFVSQLSFRFTFIFFHPSFSSYFSLSYDSCQLKWFAGVADNNIFIFKLFCIFLSLSLSQTLTFASTFWFFLFYFSCQKSLKSLVSVACFLVSLSLSLVSHSLTFSLFLSDCFLILYSSSHSL